MQRIKHISKAIRETVNRCEKCAHSPFCMKLILCDEYTPAPISNFGIVQELPSEIKDSFEFYETFY